jgi:23S rRNA (guanosine2251-2'-O)-methyltransferase
MVLVNKVYFTGYTPYPITDNDDRLPYVRTRVDKKISKTALGAEKFVDWEHREDIFKLLSELSGANYQLIALEQTSNSIDLQSYIPKSKVVLVIGREVEGVEPEILNIMDTIIEIPMLGKKESFNVVQAAAMALYKIRYC